jgi:hypothetical protein
MARLPCRVVPVTSTLFTKTASEPELHDHLAPHGHPIQPRLSPTRVHARMQTRRGQCVRRSGAGRSGHPLMVLMRDAIR